MTRDLFSTDAGGRRRDAHLHEPILANAAAQEEAARQAVARAVARGVPRAEAIRLYCLNITFK